MVDQAYQYMFESPQTGQRFYKDGTVAETGLMSAVVEEQAKPVQCYVRDGEGWSPVDPFGS